MRMTDPVSGRKLKKGQPVPNAPTPDNLDIAADTVRRTVRQVGDAATRAGRYTLPNPPGTPPSPGESFGAGVKRNVKDLNSFVGPRQTAPPPSTGPGSFNAALKKKVKGY